jgi:hypothetical protein
MCEPLGSLGYLLALTRGSVEFSLVVYENIAIFDERQHSREFTNEDAVQVSELYVVMH